MHDFLEKERYKATAKKAFFVKNDNETTAAYGINRGL
jgi:hypothetical protein